MEVRKVSQSTKRAAWVESGMLRLGLEAQEGREGDKKRIL